MARTGRTERRGTPADLLVVGLGNPGAEYAHTRHNVGFDVVELLAERHGGSLRKGKERALVDEVRIDGRRVALAEPQTYMNLSGESVSSHDCSIANDVRRGLGIEPMGMLNVPAAPSPAATDGGIPAAVDARP